jgi:5-methylthioadenosine/S-adenosylhomocysteine deaminase
LDLPAKYDLAVEGGTYLTFDKQATIIHDGVMLVNKGLISFVGPAAKAPAYRAETVIKANGRHILPAFFNQHTHLSLSLYRGLGADLKLHDWLERVIWPLEAAYCNPGNVYLGSALSLIEMIRNGTGTIANMDFHSLAVGKAAEESGLRVFLGEGLFDDKTPSAETPRENFDYTIDLINKYSDNELISIYITPHAPFSCSEDLYARSGELGRKWNIPVCSHLCETNREVEFIREKYGVSPVEYLERTGILNSHFIAIHGVHFNNKDIEMLASRDVSVIHNPHSNMVLGSGLSHVTELIKKGIKVGIGTDSAASNNNLSILRELQTAYLVHKGVNHDPTLLPAYRVLELAVKAGYEIYRMEGLGMLKAGYKSDFTIIDLGSVHNLPVIDPYSSIVSSSHSSDIESLVVNGKIIMKDRKILTLDEESIIKEAKQFGKKLAVSLPDAGRLKKK